ncbi:hypothetical protein WA026_012728 [Henosepilachna vigintioctopunctata]|uniref:DUF4371 domain-containing protein n=1 Tax=Henosepilachna vigintioctopunctata TaxID=420089 RepID=A0AAW1U6X9_9CUCU
MKESFINSIEVAGKTGEDIAHQISEKLAVDDLDIGQCRGQSYDNGSNMASIHKRVGHYKKNVRTNSKESSQKRWSAKHVALNALLNNLPGIATLRNMRQNPMEYWIKKAEEVAERSGVDPILQNKRIPKRKKHFDEMVDDELQTLQPVQLFCKEIMMVFDRIISEIEERFDCATKLNFNFPFRNDTNILKMSIEELQKYGADLARKYERDLSAV